MSKTLEKVVHILNENDLPYKNHFGIRPKHSTMCPVLQSVLDILGTMESTGKQL